MLSLGSTLEMLLSMPTIIFVVGGLIAIVSVLGGIISNTIIARARERTRREIAAYVAEGTIDADKAVEMLNAGRSKDRCETKL